MSRNSSNLGWYHPELEKARDFLKFIRKINDLDAS